MSGADKPTPEKSVQDFLQRWSRRKLGVAEAEDAAAPAAMEAPQTGEPQPAPEPTEACPESVAFDLASLPPIESIGAATDIRAFLAPGVPVELARAALRRAWTSDPAIRDFIGLAENQWDFANPDAVPGFGALEFTDEVRAMVSRLFGEAAQRAGTSAPAEFERPDEAQASTDTKRLSTPAPEPSPQVEREHHAALQNDSGTAEREPAQRRHGTALPK
jgi:hypothetical protein